MKEPIEPTGEPADSKSAGSARSKGPRGLDSVADEVPPGAGPARTGSGNDRLSYKFQRLREKLRQSIASGELRGKLPGERQLARRFRVNAKTLSKALTDLAAEGLLDRSIGRGTFVKASGSQSAPRVTTTDRCLIVCAAGQSASESVRQLLAANAGAQIVHDTSSLRPSFLSQFKAVIDFGPDTPAGFLRDLVVRGASVVVVGREPTMYSLNAVVVDRTLGGTHVARELMLAGHRRFLTVERRGSSILCEAIRKAGQRYAPDASVDVAFVSEASAAIEAGITAIVCDSVTDAAEVRSALARDRIEIPDRVSLAAVDSVGGDYPCSGYYVDARHEAEAVLQLLREGQSRRPTTLWLAGAFCDAGTTGPTRSMIHAATIAAEGGFDSTRL